MVGKILNNLFEWISNSRQREIDFYLSQSTDMVDLERRIRDLDKRIW